MSLPSVHLSASVLSGVVSAILKHAGTGDEAFTPGYISDIFSTFTYELGHYHWSTEGRRRQPDARAKRIGLTDLIRLTLRADAADVDRWQQYRPHAQQKWHARQEVHEPAH